jgi:hypothetical protein
MLTAPVSFRCAEFDAIDALIERLLTEDGLLIAGGSIAASDLVLYNSANMPADDSATSGGAIDPLRRPDFTQMSVTETVRIVSSAAGDTTQTVTITGRLADGTIASETLNLNGTTVVTSSNTYERLLKAEMSATATGTVTVARTTGPTTIRVIPIGERGFLAVFRQDASDPSSQKDYFVKVFWKNTHSTLTLTSAVVKENADPSTDISFALAAALDDSGSVANRVTSPGLTFNSSDKNVPNSQNLTHGSAIGTWLNLTLAAGAAALKSTYTTELDGQTV